MSLKDVFFKIPTDATSCRRQARTGQDHVLAATPTGYQTWQKVLVFSVDPQASLSDIFKQDIFGKGC